MAWFNQCSAEACILDLFWECLILKCAQPEEVGGRGRGVIRFLGGNFQCTEVI